MLSCFAALQRVRPETRVHPQLDRERALENAHFQAWGDGSQKTSRQEAKDELIKFIRSRAIYLKVCTALAYMLCSRLSVLAGLTVLEVVTIADAIVYYTVHHNRLDAAPTHDWTLGGLIRVLKKPSEDREFNSKPTETISTIASERPNHATIPIGTLLDLRLAGRRREKNCRDSQSIMVKAGHSTVRRTSSCLKHGR